MGWSDLYWLEDVHMGYEEGRPAVFDRNINGWVTVPADLDLPDSQQDRDMLAREFFAYHRRLYDLLYARRFIVRETSVERVTTLSPRMIHSFSSLPSRGCLLRACFVLSLLVTYHEFVCFRELEHAMLPCSADITTEYYIHVTESADATLDHKFHKITTNSLTPHSAL